MAETRRTDVIRRAARLALPTFPQLSYCHHTRFRSPWLGVISATSLGKRIYRRRLRWCVVIYSSPPLLMLTPPQKSKTTMTGTQYQKSKEDAAAIMREKQKRGAHIGMGILYPILIISYSG